MINKMVKPLYYCLFLPVTLLAVLCKDSEFSIKFVCIGNSVDVFQNVTATILKSEYIFYKLFESNHETIARWVMQNFSTNGTINNTYTDKVTLKNGTILLQKFQALDEATYGMMRHQNSFKTEKVKLCALVPPSLPCKPNIKRDGNRLIASLDNPENCGKPLVSIRWQDIDNVSYRTPEYSKHTKSQNNRNVSIIELPPGNEAGTYKACTEGENLKCMKNSSEQDNCNSITIKSNTYTPQANITMIVAIIVALVIVVVIVIIIIILWKRFKHVPCLERGRATRTSSMRTGDAADADNAAGQGYPETEHLTQSEDIEMHQMSSDAEAEQRLAQDRNIELQAMSGVHHQLEP